MLASMFVTLGGCAALAVRPPTPAKDIPLDGLDDPEPGTRYFIVIFGSQSVPKVPWETHTFGTVMKTNDAANPADLRITEHHTISWLPVTKKLRVFALHPEPGRNLGLIETLQFALGREQRVSQWGPYEIRPRLYRRFVVQKGFLDSGAVGYQAIDTIGEAACKGNGSDCVHAITDLDPLWDRRNYPLFRLGEDASRWVIKQFWDRGGVIDQTKTYPELNPQLGLCQFPIVQRRYPK
jgi:hypothetical protein